MSDLRQRQAQLLKNIASGDNLPDDWMIFFLANLLHGKFSASWIAALLMGLSCRGVSEDELFQAVGFLRKHIHAIAPGSQGRRAVDVCGTGGDGQNTLNVSTAVALLLGSLDIPCAKHGGRASSSLSGARDVLEALGIAQTPSDDGDVEKALSTHHIAFLAASFGESDLRPLRDARKALGIASLFNLLGPLLNPLGVKRQVVGVFSLDYLDMLPKILTKLGAECVWGVCGWSTYGEGSIDEVTLSGESEIFAVEHGQQMRYRVNPAMFGLSDAPISAIKGGNSLHNARAIEELVNGHHSAYRDTVLMNGAIALHVSGHGKITTGSGEEIDRTALKENVACLARALDNGRTRKFLDNLRLSSKDRQSGLKRV